MAATLGPAPAGGPFPLFDAHPRDRAGDHELLDLARALEDRVDTRDCTLVKLQPRKQCTSTRCTSISYDTLSQEEGPVVDFSRQLATPQDGLRDQPLWPRCRTPSADDHPVRLHARRVQRRIRTGCSQTNRHSPSEPRRS